MKAEAGDKIVIHGHEVGRKVRTATIVEVQGEDGAPPYLVRWDDDPHDQPTEHLFFPGPDADVEHIPAAASDE